MDSRRYQKNLRKIKQDEWIASYQPDKVLNIDDTPENHLRGGAGRSMSAKSRLQCKLGAEKQLRLRRMGLGQISIDGRLYKTQKQACEALQIERSLFRTQLKSPHWPTWFIVGGPKDPNHKIKEKREAT